MDYKLKVFILGLALLLLHRGEGAASLRQVPVPAHTEEVKKEQRTLYTDSDSTFIYYASSLSKNEIADFYRRRLQALGWQEQDYATEAAKIPGLDLDVGLTDALKAQLSFSRDNEQVMVNFLPPGIYQDKLTRYNIFYTEIAGVASAEPADTGLLLPALDKAPKKQAVPGYPGAKLVTLSEQGGSYTANYIAEADLPEVTSFYKDELAQGGWQLVMEQPSETRWSEDFNLINATEDCPECGQAGNRPQELLRSVKVRVSEMDFVNMAGDSCKLILTTSKGEMDDGSSRSITAILVDYNEKKE